MLPRQLGFGSREALITCDSLSVPLVVAVLFVAIIEGMSDS